LGVVVRCSVVDACFELEHTSDKVHDLTKTPLEGSCDVSAREHFPTLGFDDSVLLNPLDHSHTSCICSLPSHSPEYYLNEPTDNHMICDANVDLGYDDNIFDVLGGNVDNFVSLGYLNASFNPHCMYLVAALRKIMWTIFLDFSLDFSMTFGLLKVTMTLFATIILMLSHCHACESHAIALDKYLRTLKTFNLTSQVLSSRWSD